MLSDVLMQSTWQSKKKHNRRKNDRGKAKKKEISPSVVCDVKNKMCRGLIRYTHMCSGYSSDSNLNILRVHNLIESNLTQFSCFYNVRCSPSYFLLPVPACTPTANPHMQITSTVYLLCMPLQSVPGCSANLSPRLASSLTL